MSTQMPHPGASETETVTHRVAAVLLTVGGDTGRALDAMGRQSLEPVSVTIVGEGREVEATAEARGMVRYPSLRELTAVHETDADLFWVVHDDALPRPDALASLVAELDRNDASMVGSKVLDAVHSDQLESVGSATDVFGEPYSGLDPGEVDLEQYDVVRDVAFVSGVSVLIRRDLLRGLRGTDPKLPPVAAGMDLSQRARIAGGRVMVAPSSEVLHHRTCGHDVAGWREWAGRMRAMLKAYRFVTLSWLLLVGTVVGLVDGFTRLLLGSPKHLLDFFRAAGWNVVNLPSTIAARASLRPVRLAGDEELFRYQVSGSVRMRALVTDLAERFGWVIDEEPGVVTEEEMLEGSTAIGPVVAGVAVLSLGIAARALWFGNIPVVGYSLPVGDDTAAVLASYAGGWNPGGLGSPEPVHPSAALVAALRWLLGGWAGTQSLLTMAAMLAGMIGVSRLARRWGVDGPTRHLGGLALFLGPIGLAIAESSFWSGVVAMGPMVWMVDLALAPWPEGGRARLSRIGGLMLASALTGALAPLAVMVALVATIAGWVLLPGVGLGAVARGFLAMDVGALAAAPYLLGARPEALLSEGPRVELWPGPLLVGLLTATAVLAVLGAVERRWRLAGWAGLLMLGGLSGSLVSDVAGDAAIAFAAAGSLGSALVVAAALGVNAASDRWRLAVHGIAAAGAVALVASGLVALPAGRGGMPEDRWSDKLGFVESLADDPAAGRVLLVGRPESLPGSSRPMGAYSYRVLGGSAPTLEEAWLASPRLGDDALDGAITDIALGDVVRPGSRLSEFAIQWVVILDDAPITDALLAQVDLVEFPVVEGLRVFRNDVVGSRIEASDGSRWTTLHVGGTGPASAITTVRVADNAHPGWAPDWQQDGWANRLSAAEGRVWFEPAPLRRALAWISLALVFIGGGLATLGWRRS